MAVSFIVAFDARLGEATMLRCNIMSKSFVRPAVLLVGKSLEQPDHFFLHRFF
jgi:hypothetical protein